MQGNKILLKAIAQAIPSYAMSIFKLPKGICKSITNELTAFGVGWGRRVRLRVKFLRDGFEGFYLV